MGKCKAGIGAFPAQVCYPHHKGAVALWQGKHRGLHGQGAGFAVAAGMPHRGKKGCGEWEGWQGKRVPRRRFSTCCHNLRPLRGNGRKGWAKGHGPGICPVQSCFWGRFGGLLCFLVGQGG